MAWRDGLKYRLPAAGGAAKPLMVVARTDQVRVFIDIPEMEAALVEPSDPVTLRVQALGGKELQATVTRTSWSLDKANRALRAEVDIPNDHSLLRPGMYATARVLLERRENALVLPVTAIVRAGDESWCCCVEASKIVRRPVELGLRSGPEIELLNGIAEDAAVVLARADSLEEGQPVVVMPPRE